MRQTGAAKSRDSPAVECLSLSSELPLLTRHNRGRFARRLASTRERSPRSRTRVRHARANSRSVPAAASRAFVASSRRSRGRRSRTSNLSFKRPGLETGQLAARPRPRTPRDDRSRGERHRGGGQSMGPRRGRSVGVRHGDVRGRRRRGRPGRGREERGGGDADDPRPRVQPPGEGRPRGHGEAELPPRAWGAAQPREPIRPGRDLHVHRVDSHRGASPRRRRARPRRPRFSLQRQSFRLFCFLVSRSIEPPRRPTD